MIATLRADKDDSTGICDLKHIEAALQMKEL